MRAMVLTRAGLGHVESLEIEKPAPGPSDVLVKVLACGVCRTDLHVIDGELPNTAIPIVPGHEIVGRVEAVGRDVTTHAPGDRVGIPWLGWSCGVCEFCSGRAREPVPQRPLHGLSAQWRVRRVCGCRRLILLFTSVTVRRFTCGTAPVCRADRVPGVSHGGAGPENRRLWLRRSRAHHHSGRAVSKGATCTPLWRRATIRR